MVVVRPCKQKLGKTGRCPFKLLGLVPIVSILLFLGLYILSDSAIKIFGNIIGLIIRIAAWLYGKRNSELNDDLISRARKIDSELGIETGQFLGRKLNSSFLVKRDIALNIIYFTSMIVCLVFIVYQFFILF